MVLITLTKANVASLGRILGNRSVLYKYLNENIISLISQSKSLMHVYLLDSVSGAIRYKASHKTEGASQLDSVNIIQYENVVVYSFWKDTLGGPKNLSTKSVQLMVLEMYESNVPDVRIQG